MAIRSTDDGEDTSSLLVVSHKQSSEQVTHVTSIPQERSKEIVGVRKLASAIVSPLGDHPMEENVTVRNIGEGRILLFSPSVGNDPIIEDDQMIGALSEMEPMDHLAGEMMEDEIEGDDLLGLDLMEMEDSSSLAIATEVGDDKTIKSTRARKHGNKRGASLGMNTKKFEIIRRGSPSRRTIPSRSHNGNGDKQKKNMVQQSQRMMV